MTRKFINPIISACLIMSLVSILPVRKVKAASWTVTKTADTDDGVCDTDCSLREAVAEASGGDEIGFDGSLANTTITLSTPITIDKDLTISGTSLYPGDITISGGDSVRLFNINTGQTLNLNTMNLIDGYSSALDGGGAIYINSSAALNIEYCSISGNTAIGGGGAIYNLGTLDINSSTFAENQGGSGGAIYSTSSLTISGSTFNNNNADFASAVFDSGTSDVFNSTFYENTVTSSSSSGAYYASGTAATITNCTFAENSAPSSTVGGLFQKSPTFVNLKNTIIADSSATYDCYAESGFTSDVNNLIESHSGCGFPLLSSDPRLDILRDNYFPTPATVALLPGSPAIDAGDNSVCAYAGTVNNFDQRGRPRPIDADLDGTPVCDIGSQEAEVRYVAPTGSDTSNNCLNNGSPCGTVSHAVNSARAGDVVSIAAGLYMEGSQLLIGGRPVDIVGAGMDESFLDGNGSHRVMYVSDEVVRISDLTVQNGNDSAAVGGGGIFNTGQLTLLRLRIDGNTANSHGGGITSNEYLLMEDCIVSNNDATGTDMDGGGLYFYGGDSYAEINRSVINDNTATGKGGGVNFAGPLTLDVVNTTISTNFAAYGAGITNGVSGTVTILNSTITNNQLFSGTYGGGLANSSTMIFKNTIIAENDGAECHNVGGSLTSQGYNLSSDSTCNFTQTGDQENTNPLLGFLEDNGGYSPTHALTAGSPAIDAGTNTGCPTVDQRGISRPQGSLCDIGAFEGELTVFDAIGMYSRTQKTWYLKDANTDGWLNVTTVRFGSTDSSWIPVVGDWNGNGTDTIGMYSRTQKTWYLKDTNTDGWGDVTTIRFGSTDSSWIPVVGDWNGDGTDTIGMYSRTQKTWYLKDANVDGWGGVTTVRFGSTDSSWIPVVGDWNNCGPDKIGMYSRTQKTWYLKGANDDGWSNVTTVRFGSTDSSWIPVVGDWSGNGTDTIAMYSRTQKTWYLKDANVDGWGGVTTVRFGSTDASWLPVNGKW